MELQHPEAFVGRLVCDDIVEVYEDEVLSVVGARTPSALRAANAGLSAALGLND